MAFCPASLLVPVKSAHRATQLSSVANLRDFLQTYLAGLGFLNVQHFLMVASPISLLPLWISSTVSIEHNGRTYTRLCAASGLAKTYINLSFALQFFT
jgi:hypothetical protein